MRRVTLVPPNIEVITHLNPDNYYLAINRYAVCEHPAKSCFIIQLDNKHSTKVIAFKNGLIYEENLLNFEIVKEITPEDWKDA